MTRPKTLSEALLAGYKPGRTAWQRGYVSRKQDNSKATVLVARGGELYVRLPSWKSTYYCVRQYLVAPHEVTL